MSRRLNPWQIQGYKAGQNVICKVDKAEPGGYAVVIVKDNLPGFLPTQAILRTGEDVLAQFVCVHNNRILLSARFSNNISKSPSSHEQVRWEEQLDQIDTAPPAQEEPVLQPPAEAPQTHQSGTPIMPPSGATQPALASPQPPVQQTAPYPDHQYQYGLPTQQAAPQPQAYPQASPSQQQAGQSYQQGSAAAPPQEPPPDPFSRKFSYKSEKPNQSQQAPIQLSPPPQPQMTEEEAAFAAWAPAATPTKKFHLKRATDLILPPMEDDTPEKFTIAENDLEWLITIIEGGMVTGCVKASSEERLSRAAMLLYRGRAVGCIYGCKSMPETQPTEQSLQQMLADLELPQTSVTKYDLPEDVTLAMSALFLGYPVQRNDDYDARSYMDYICNWFEGKQQTACLAITLPSNAATCLGFIYKGKFCGAFYVEDQKFTREREFVYELLKRDPQAMVEASILPPEMTSSAVRFGFSLSMARQRRLE